MPAKKTETAEPAAVEEPVVAEPIPAPAPPVAQAVASTTTQSTATGTATVSQVGISDDMKQFLSSSDFKMDWTRRRWVVIITLFILGIIISGISGVLCTLLFFREDSDFENLLDVVSTLIYVDIFAVLTIIGSYVFGAQYDASNFRSSVISIMNSTKGRGQPVDPNAAQQ